MTSDLDAEFRKADHRHGEWAKRKISESRCNSIAFKILTSNPYALKILQTIFAEPAPVKAFRGGWGRGVPSNLADFPKSTQAEKGSNQPSNQIYLEFFSTVAKI